MIDNTGWDAAGSDQSGRVSKIHGLLLSTGFSMSALLQAVGTLKDCNTENSCRHDWYLVSEDDAPVICESGVPVTAHVSIKTACDFATISLFTGKNTLPSPELTEFIKEQLQLGVSLVVLGAQAGHFKPFSCVKKTPSWLVCSDIRSIPLLFHRLSRTTNQPPVSTDKLDHRLAGAIALMKNNIEEPLSLKDLVFHLGISKRQLERLFKKQLITTPGKYYLNLRLWEARNILQAASKKAILQVGLSCGFSNAAHFSKAYRQRFGIPPSREEVVG